MSNLLKLLQPKEYRSKIKLYCPLIVANFPHFVKAFSAQKTLKQQEKRNKVINICEIEN
jgi:predicted PP-loop superfamily ATPase